MIHWARWAAAVTAALAALTLAAAGMLGWPAALTALGYLAAGTMLLDRALLAGGQGSVGQGSVEPSRTTQRYAVGAAVLCAAALVVGLDRNSAADVVALTVPVTALAAVVATHKRALVTSSLASGAALVLALATRPTPLVGVLVAVSWVMLLFTLRLAHLLAHPTGGSPARSPVTVVGPLLTTLVVGLLAMLVVPVSFGSSATAAGSPLRDRLLGESVRPPTFDFGPMDMNARGDLATSEVAKVSADSPLYWRSAVLSGYDGQSWYPTPVQADGRVSLTDDGLDVSRLMGNDAPATGTLQAFRVTPLESGSTVIAPGHLQAIRPAVEVAYRDGHSVQIPRSDGYEVVVTLPEPAAQASPVPGKRSSVSPEYLSLPASVTPRTRALATRITAAASDQAQAVALIEQYLRDTYSYRLDAPVAPRGHDAVDYFLFESRQGFCEHFAAAEVVLLRALDIPARVAVGYQGGQDNGGWRTITADRAHAWTEVAVPGRGWLTSDSTPSAPPDQGAAWDVARRWWREFMGSMVLRLLVAAAILLVAVSAWMILRRRAQSTPAETNAPPRARNELQAACQRFLAALHRTGHPSSPAETYAELARRVAPAADGLHAVELDSYGARPLSPEQAREAAAQLDVVTAHLLAEHARP